MSTRTRLRFNYRNNEIAAIIGHSLKLFAKIIYLISRRALSVAIHDKIICPSYELDIQADFIQLDSSRLKNPLNPAKIERG